MLQDFTVRIFKFWSSWDLGAGQWEISRAAVTSAQVCGRLQEQPKPLRKLWRRVDAIFLSKRFEEFQNNQAFCLSYLYLIQTQDWLHLNLAWIILVSLYIYIWRYRDNWDGLSNREYIFGRARGRLTSSHYMKYTLYFYQSLVSSTLAESPYIHAIYVVPHALLPSVHRSVQLEVFIMPRDHFLSLHPLPTLLEPELLHH